ncbi:hypothetical protein [Kamptonema formosum]|uniref:hypothetical protein n=1 Tax=Kamptonema formosum TaxID=331992 RepID=UPI0003458FCD|nr:hypothetical protein [Oscillatoria sp. PCC 10802]
MEKIELELDGSTLARARAMANQRNCALPELIAEAINKLAVAEPPKDSILGMFADDPESVDEMLAEVMKDRAAHPLNQRFGPMLE